MKKIVILMSVYNGSKYIREQIESIVRQDLRQDKNWNVELCIRIDGSNDDSINIINEFQDQIKIYTFKGENVGPAKSFWKLLKLAPEAEYYAFCDQDDYWFTDKLSRAILCLEKKCESVPQLYCTAVQSTDDKLNPIIRAKSNKAVFVDFPHALVYSLTAGCTFVFNRKALEMACKYDMDRNHVEMHDWLIHKIIAMSGDVSYDPRPSMYYRQHSNNVIGDRTVSMKNIMIRVKNIMIGNKCVRSETARSLRCVYGEWLNKHPEKKYYIDLLADYKQNKELKRKLLLEKGFRTSIVQNLIFYALVFLGKI